MTLHWLLFSCSFFFFFNDTATTEIYTLSLHDALPLSAPNAISPSGGRLFYLLNRAWPVFPAAVFSVKVMAAPAVIGFFASPFMELSPDGAKVIVSRFEPLTISTAPV